MGLIQWRNEGEKIRPGLNVYRPSGDHLGFILDLDRHFIAVRYSKQINRWYFMWQRLEPRAWRILKGE